MTKRKIYVESRCALPEDYLENWIAHNPVLERGEPSIVRNPKNESEWLKFGDGETAWVDLPYKMGPRGYKGDSLSFDDLTDEQLEGLKTIVETIINQNNKVVPITLYANKWEGDKRLYFQVVDIEGIPKDYTGTVRLTPVQAENFSAEDVSFMVGNENGIITVYCIGQKLMNDYTVDIKFEKENRI